MISSLLARRRLGALRTERRSKIRGHRIDFVFGPERAAADHAIERSLPAAAVLALVFPHTLAVTLKTFRHEQIFTRAVGQRLTLLGGVDAERRQQQNPEHENESKSMDHRDPPCSVRTGRKIAANEPGCQLGNYPRQKQ